MSKFTDDEKIIAKNISKKYKWMARDKNGNLYVYNQKPSKCQKYWNAYGCIEKPMYMFNSNIFKSITWEDNEPTRISDIYNPQILDDVEREYLKTILKPFRNKLDYVEKLEDYHADRKEYLFIKFYDGKLTLPDFGGGKMYAGMERNKRYKLDELGITYDN